MNLRSRFASLLFIAVALIVTRTGEAHLHLCLDGQEPRASFHVADTEAFCDDADAEANGHQDEDVDTASAALLKSTDTLQDFGPPVVATILFLVAPQRFSSDFCELTASTNPQHPYLFRPLGQRLRRRIAETSFGPSGAWWLRDRVIGKVDIQLQTTVRHGAVRNGEVVLEVSRDSGPATVTGDHVVVATGFRVDLARHPFLSPEIVAGLSLVDGWPDVSHNVNKHRGVRTTKWKFIHYYDPPFKFAQEFELYDLENDPDERVNLANRPALQPTVKELRAKMEQLRKELGSTDAK